MKKYSLLLITASIVSSCYTYKTFEPEAVEIENTSASSTKISSVREDLKSAKDRNDLADAQEKRMAKIKAAAEQKSNAREKENVDNMRPIVEQKEDIEIRPKGIIKEKGYYQVEVFEKTQKIEAVKWEGDTLVAHVKGKPNKVLKLHEKDIQNLKVRQFSKGRSDALTVAAYATAGVGIFLLLK